MNLKRYITTLIALFLGLFLSKAQSSDSLTFKLEQDSMDINAFVNASINNNLFWKQHVLSNVGGPVQYLSLEIPTHFSDFKTSVYDAYIANRKPLDYSHHYKFTQLDYKTTIGEGQYISALHTQTYQQFSFGIFYQKLLSEGDFSEDKKDHVNTEFIINYHPKDKKYNTSFSLIHNISEVKENGGLLNDSIYINGLLSSNDVIDTRLTSASNEIKNTEFNWNNQYTLTMSNGISLGIHAKTAIRKESEIYRDNGLFYSSSSLINSDSYYPNFYIDSTNTSDSIGFNSLSQEFSINTSYKSFELSPYFKIARLKYNLGYKQQSTTAIQAGIFAKGFKDKFEAHIALKNRSDISLSGIEFISTISPIKPLEVQIYYNEKAPDLFYQKYESNHFRWDNSFTREKHSRIDVNFNILKKTTLKAFYHKINGYIFLNENAISSQTHLNQSSQGLELNSIIEKGKFTFSSQLLVQETSGDFIQLPNFIGRLKMAYQNKMLGGALVQPGIQLNYSSAYYAKKYMAPLSSFYLQNSEKIDNALLLDVFVNVKVSNFTFYGIFSNILEKKMLEKNFTSPHYVGPIQQFNFGIRWNFYDK